MTSVISFPGKGGEPIASVVITAGVTDSRQQRGATEQYAVRPTLTGNASQRNQTLRQIDLSYQALEMAT